MTLLLLLLLVLWLAVACFAGLVFSALVRGAGRASECPEPEQCGPAELPAPRAPAEERQRTSVA